MTGTVPLIDTVPLTGTGSVDHRCRACGSGRGEVVLDLGRQPACDRFPPVGDPGPDPVHPLRMWLCAGCGLAQLAEDVTVPEEPAGLEPAALVAQAEAAMDAVAGAGLLPAGSRVREAGSPHGGSWLGSLAGRGLVPVGEDGPADVVVDCFGLMHDPDQCGALARRVGGIAPGGVLLVQFHSLEAIVRQGQWNALRHGHYAYYSATALEAMLGRVGWRARAAWRFDLYGGTVLLAARRAGEGGPEDGAGGPASVRELVRGEAAAGVRDPAVVRGLGDRAEARARRLARWLTEARDAGVGVVGYGAASRAVALLVRAGVDRTLLPAVVDASPAKHGRRMPGTDVPVVGPAALAGLGPGRVLVFVPELVAEARAAFPQVEAAGGRWVDAEALGP